MTTGELKDMARFITVVLLLASLVTCFLYLAGAIIEAGTKVVQP